MNTPQFSFATMQDAVSALLLDVTTFLNSTGHDYMIVGGWSPFLLNKTDHRHPGTRDIDVLFSDGNVRNKLRDVIRGMLDRGYKASAKHDFQLLRPVTVQNFQLVFNVDLLHPAESEKNPEMMVDHFDLGIKDEELAESKAIKSIVLPSSALLFGDDFSSLYTLESHNLDGQPSKVSFPLLGLAGSILSKCESVNVKKRPRDAFDIFLALESDFEKEIPQLLRQYSKVKGVRNLLDTLSCFVHQAPLQPDLPYNQFDMNVFRYLENADSASPTPASRVAAALKDV